MHGVVGAVVAMVGAEVDPTVQPVRQSFWVFLFVAVLSVATAFVLIVAGSILPRVVHKPGQQPAKDSGQKVGLDLLLGIAALDLLTRDVRLVGRGGRAGSQQGRKGQAGDDGGGFT